MRMLSGRFIVYGIGLSFMVTAPCQAVDNPQPVVVTALNFTDAPFDPRITVLPTDFRGTDPVKLYINLYEKFGRPKDEFESSADYKTRLESEKQLPVVGTIKVDDTLAFLIYSASVTSTYDADHQILHVQLDTDPGSLAFLLQTGRDNISTYEASNAFGAKTTVAKEDDTIVALDVQNSKDFKFNKVEKPDATAAIGIDLPLNSSKAEAAKPRLSVLVVCKMAAGKTGYITSSTWRDAPTISNPVDITYKRYSILVKATELWIYDGKTGEVYARVKARK